MKKVFSNSSQVMHIWANQSQESARCGNVFFEGNKIYSYGHHYELGRIIDFKGTKIALINTKGYSVTTSKHITQARAAVSHLPTIEVKTGIDKYESDSDTIAKGLLDMQDDLVTNIMEVFTSRKFTSYDGKIRLILGYSQDEKEFNKLCDLFKRKELKIEISNEFFDLMNDHIRKMHARKLELDAQKHTPEYLEQKARRERRKIELDQEKIQTDILKWRAGGLRTDSLRQLRPMLLRVNISTEIVQTSGGAEVPLDHALRLLRLVEKGKVKHGDKVGHFTVDSIRNNIIKIGCHEISITEAKNVLTPYVTKLTLVKEG